MVPPSQQIRIAEDPSTLIGGLLRPSQAREQGIRPWDTPRLPYSYRLQPAAKGAGFGD